MKNKRSLGYVFSSLLALGALSAQAQNNFWWTNTVNDVWANGANWSNDLGGALAPLAGGSNDYAFTFQNAGAVSTINNLESPGFLLNQLASDTGAGAVTIFGTSLVFASSSTAVLPGFTQNSASLVT